jgi:outer membrane protein TolC
LSAIDSFKLRLGLPISEELYLDDRDLRELIQTGLVPVEVDRLAAFGLCLSNQMEILTAVDEFEDSKRKIRVAADQLRAELNVFGNARLASEGPEDYTQFDPDKVRYNAGISLDLPIDRLRERNSYRATLVSFESQMRARALTLDNYRDRIDRGLRTIEQARLNYINGLESLKVAQRRVENNSMLLEAGRATVRDLRESQDQLVSAENTLASLYAAYSAARLNLMVNLGVIDINPRKFWLQDPLAGKLSPNQKSVPPLRMPDDQVVPPDNFLEPSS